MKVFELIHFIRHELITLVDTTTTWEQLNSPKIQINWIKPILISLSNTTTTTTTTTSPLIYALLINRIQFLHESKLDLNTATRNITRADLCELLAIKLCSTTSSQDLLTILTTSFSPFDGIMLNQFESNSITQMEIDDLIRLGSNSSNALETAIFSKAKHFIKTPIIQTIITSIYKGEIIYQPVNHASLRDDYKKRNVVETYDWKTKPFLDHHRLRVPQVRSTLEFMTFVIILVLFLLAETTRNYSAITLWEALFCVYASGFVLDELATLSENGIAAYLYGIYNVLDAVFCLIFIIFLGLRAHALATDNLVQSKLAFDTLSLGALALFPRLSISFIRENIILLALSAMIKEFTLFMILSALTASGVLVALYCLAQGAWHLDSISWLLLRMWLGSTYLGFDVASDFHPFFGPALVVFFSFLTQTLLLTMLISILSNSFAQITANAESEITLQKALRTIERAKSDAVTNYVPPLNLVAIIVLLPVHVFASPRWFHKINASLSKFLNFPVLLFLALSTRISYIRSRRTRGIQLDPLQENHGYSTGRGWMRWQRSTGVERVFERHVVIRTTRGVAATTGTNQDGTTSSLAEMYATATSPTITEAVQERRGDDGDSERMAARLDSIEGTLTTLLSELRSGLGRSGVSSSVAE